jgi:hypothetical protein
MQTTTRELPREQWQRYFDELVSTQSLRASLELIGPELGDQTQAEQLPLHSLSYDDYEDAILIGLGGSEPRYPVALWHPVERPRRVEVYERDQAPAAILIEADDELRTLLRLTPDHDQQSR